MKQTKPSADVASVFHEGELNIQAHLGYQEKLKAAASHTIRDFMPEQHRLFFAQLPFLLVGSMDDNGQPWASILIGDAGFISSADNRHLLVSAAPLPGDPLHDSLAAGSAIGLLGIEFHSRRRNRLNGIIKERTPNGFQLQVGQSFGNCPKYIHKRRPCRDRPVQQNPRIHNKQHLDASMQRIVEKADTFFIASAHPDAQKAEESRQGVDVSHRGGKAGFVRLEKNGQVLVAPDYTGNFFFNTMGNLILNPRAGLLFMDFDSGDLLYLAVSTKIIWHGPELTKHENAQRLLRMQVHNAIRVENILPWHWSEPE